MMISLKTKNHRWFFSSSNLTCNAVLWLNGVIIFTIPFRVNFIHIIPIPKCKNLGFVAFNITCILCSAHHWGDNFRPYDTLSSYTDMIPSSGQKLSSLWRPLVAFNITCNFCSAHHWGDNFRPYDTLSSYTDIWFHHRGKNYRPYEDHW